MTTLILRKNRSGAVTGMCNAKCYNAKGKKCKCICAGINHGKGLREALELTVKHQSLILSTRRDGEAFIVQLQTLFSWEDFI